MGLFESQEDMYDDDYYRPNGGAKIVKFFIKLIVALIGFPALLIGAIHFWALFAWGHLRVSVVAIITAFELAIVVPVILANKPIQNILTIFKFEGNTNWGSILASYIMICVIVGILGSFFMVSVKAYQFNHNPSLLFMDGWMYNFSYRDTPWELIKRKYLKAAMAEGKFYTEEGSPLGLLEEPISAQVAEIDDTKVSLQPNKTEVVARAYEDAMRHSIVTGETGSGKALHVDTVIPTPYGFSTVGALNVGDVIFDENGKKTSIIGKYQPMTEDHYEITFSNGETVRACGDHLWEVIKLNERSKFGAKQQFNLSVSALRKLNDLQDEFITKKELIELGFKKSLVMDKLLFSNEELSYLDNSYKVKDVINVLNKVRKSNSEYNEISEAIEILLTYPNDVITRKELYNNEVSPRVMSKYLVKVEKETEFKENVYNIRKIKDLFNKEHIRRSWINYDLEFSKRDNLTEVINTREMLNSLRNERDRLNYAVTYSKSVDYEEVELPIEPYLFGAWLGDGISRRGSVVGVDLEVKDEIVARGSVVGSEYLTQKVGYKDIYEWRVEGLFNKLNTLNLIQKDTKAGSQKDIPDIYLTSSYEQRLALISGLIDTDGSVSNEGTASIGLTNENVVRKAHIIVKSLGWNVSPIHEKENYSRHSDGSRTKGKNSFTFSFTPKELVANVLRKKERIENRLSKTLTQEVRKDRHYIVDIKEIKDNKEDYFCFTVDSPSHLFLCTESFIPTHNTVTMLSLIYNDIQNGFPVCVVDFKKSPDVLYFLSKWAKDFGREFYYFSGGDSTDKGNPFYGEKATYDPFTSGEQSSRSDVILSLRQWDTASDVYRSRTESLLNALFFALLNVDRKEVPNIPWDEGGLNQIIAAMELPVMFDLIKAMDNKAQAGTLSKTDLRRISTLKEIYNSLREKTPAGKGLKEQLDGIKLICNKLIMSSYGSWLSKGMSQEHIDLLKIATSDEGPIVLFGLSPLEEEEFAKSIGSIIMSDLKRAAHTKNEMHNQIPFGVYIDEFQTIDPADVTDLLEKGRSAKFFCTIASQSLEQVVVSSLNNGEATLKAVLDTCGNYIFHSGAKQDSAERMAKILGETRHIVRRASTKANTKIFSGSFFNQRQGIVNKEITSDWIIAPSKFQNLSSPNKKNGYKSEAYVITKVGDEDTATTFGAQRIQVIAQKEITAGMPTEFKDFIGRSAIERHKRQTGEDISGFAGIKFAEADELSAIEDRRNSDMDEVANLVTHKRSPLPIIDEPEEDDWEIEEINSETDDTIIPDEIPVKSIERSEPQTKAVSSNTKNKEKLPEFERKRPMTSFERMQEFEKNKKKTPKKKEEVIQKTKVKHPVSDKQSADSENTEKSPFKLPDL